MEHKIVLGGEQFLPFARSRIKALRALGLPYADQSFEIDGVSIKVRIEPGHEYIRLEGGLKILSGAIRKGEIVELPATEIRPAYKTLRAYKPTQNAWEVVLGKPPTKPTTSFNDENFLAKVEAASPTQYADLSPSMYSGLMAKVVAVIMGRGLSVKYDYKWEHCHGVALDSAGKPWLIEISRANGVLAMRLPLDSGNKKSKVDAERKIVELLGGVPNGQSFPSDLKLAAALASGSVLRLATVADMTPYFDKTPFSEALGWSFNNSGSEAHNTCSRVGAVNAAEIYGCHYKLSISIAPPEGDAPANASAELTLIEEGQLFSDKSFVHTYQGSIPFKFDGALANVNQDTPESVHIAPVFVCHIGGVLEVVRVKSRFNESDIEEVDNPSAGYVPYGDFTQVTHPAGNEITAFSSVISTTNLKRTAITKVVERQTLSTTTYFFYSPEPDYTVGTWTLGADWHTTFVIRRTDVQGVSADNYLSWSRGLRDGYSYVSGRPSSINEVYYGGSAWVEEGLTDHLAAGGTVENFYTVDLDQNPRDGVGYYDRLVVVDSTSPGLSPDNPGTEIAHVETAYSLTPLPKQATFKVFKHDASVFTEVDENDPPAFNLFDTPLVRVSAFGASTQTFISLGEYRATEGELLSGETDEHPDVFNFIGFT